MPKENKAPDPSHIQRRSNANHIREPMISIPSRETLTSNNLSIVDKTNSHQSNYNSPYKYILPKRGRPFSSPVTRAALNVSRLSNRSNVISSSLRRRGGISVVSKMLDNNLVSAFQKCLKSTTVNENPAPGIIQISVTGGAIYETKQDQEKASSIYEKFRPIISEPDYPAKDNRASRPLTIVVPKQRPIFLPENRFYAPNLRNVSSTGAGPSGLKLSVTPTYASKDILYQSAELDTREASISTVGKSYHEKFTTTYEKSSLNPMYHKKQAQEERTSAPEMYDSISPPLDYSQDRDALTISIFDQMAPPEAGISEQLPVSTPIYASQGQMYHEENLDPRGTSISTVGKSHDEKVAAVCEKSSGSQICHIIQAQEEMASSSEMYEGISPHLDNSQDVDAFITSIFEQTAPPEAEISGLQPVRTAIYASQGEMYREANLDPQGTGISTVGQSHDEKFATSYEESSESPMNHIILAQEKRTSSTEMYEEMPPPLDYADLDTRGTSFSTAGKSDEEKFATTNEKSSESQTCHTVQAQEERAFSSEMYEAISPPLDYDQDHDSMIAPLFETVSSPDTRISGLQSIRTLTYASQAQITHEANLDPRETSISTVGQSHDEKFAAVCKKSSESQTCHTVLAQEERTFSSEMYEAISPPLDYDQGHDSIITPLFETVSSPDTRISGLQSIRTPTFASQAQITHEANLDPRGTGISTVGQSHDEKFAAVCEKSSESQMCHIIQAQEERTSSSQKYGTSHSQVAKHLIPSIPMKIDLRDISPNLLLELKPGIPISKQASSSDAGTSGLQSVRTPKYASQSYLHQTTSLCPRGASISTVGKSHEEEDATTYEKCSDGTMCQIKQVQEERISSTEKFETTHSGLANHLNASIPVKIDLGKINPNLLGDLGSSILTNKQAPAPKTETSGLQSSRDSNCASQGHLNQSTNLSPQGGSMLTLGKSHDEKFAACEKSPTHAICQTKQAQQERTVSTKKYETTPFSNYEICEAGPSGLQLKTPMHASVENLYQAIDLGSPRHEYEALNEMLKEKDPFLNILSYEDDENLFKELLENPQQNGCDDFMPDLKAFIEQYYDQITVEESQATVVLNPSTETCSSALVVSPITVTANSPSIYLSSDDESSSISDAKTRARRYRRNKSQGRCLPGTYMQYRGVRLVYEKVMGSGKQPPKSQSLVEPEGQSNTKVGHRVNQGSMKSLGTEHYAGCIDVEDNNFDKNILSPSYDVPELQLFKQDGLFETVSCLSENSDTFSLKPKNENIENPEEIPGPSGLVSCNRGRKASEKKATRKLAPPSNDKRKRKSRTPTTIPTNESIRATRSDRSHLLGNMRKPAQNITLPFSNKGMVRDAHSLTTDHNADGLEVVDDNVEKLLASPSYDFPELQLLTLDDLSETLSCFSEKSDNFSLKPKNANIESPEEIPGPSRLVSCERGKKASVEKETIELALPSNVKRKRKPRTPTIRSIEGIRATRTDLSHLLGNMRQPAWKTTLPCGSKAYVGRGLPPFKIPNASELEKVALESAALCEKIRKSRPSEKEGMMKDIVSWLMDSEEEQKYQLTNPLL